MPFYYYAARFGMPQIVPMDKKKKHEDQRLTQSHQRLEEILSQMAERINEMEPLLYGLTDTLMEKGSVDMDSFSRNVTMNQQSLQKKGKSLSTGVALRKDISHLNYPEVNCEERLHICKAACCRMRFALSEQEVEKGVVRWELHRPYFIRHSEEKYCVHNDRGTCHCTVYQDRPQVCSVYSCYQDERIWTDYDNMVLNHEWLDEHLGKEDYWEEALQTKAPNRPNAE